MQLMNSEKLSRYPHWEFNSQVASFLVLVKHTGTGELGNLCQPSKPAQADHTIS